MRKTIVSSIVVVGLHALLVIAIIVLNRSDVVPVDRDAPIVISMRALDPPPEELREPEAAVIEPAEAKTEVLDELPEEPAAPSFPEPPDLAAPAVGTVEAVDIVLPRIDVARVTESAESAESAAASPPRPLAGNAPPAYPLVARRRGWSGSVRARLLVDESGAVVEARIVVSDGNVVFERAVRDAVSRWRFEPARRDGRAVAAWITQPFRFEMRER